jgi:hypothetical protein
MRRARSAWSLATSRSMDWFVGGVTRDMVQSLVPGSKLPATGGEHSNKRCNSHAESVAGGAPTRLPSRGGVLCHGEAICHGRPTEETIPGASVYLV